MIQLFSYSMNAVPPPSFSLSICVNINGLNEKHFALHLMALTLSWGLSGFLERDGRTRVSIESMEDGALGT